MVAGCLVSSDIARPAEVLPSSTNESFPFGVSIGSVVSTILCAKSLCRRARARGESFCRRYISRPNSFLASSSSTSSGSWWSSSTNSLMSCLVYAEAVRAGGGARDPARSVRADHRHSGRDRHQHEWPGRAGGGDRGADEGDDRS